MNAKKLHYEDDELYELKYELEEKELIHKKNIRKLLENLLERKRLKEELGELDGEFNWDELEDQ